MGLAKLKKQLTKAELEHNIKEVKKLHTRIFEAIFKRKKKGKSFGTKHIV